MKRREFIGRTLMAGIVGVLTPLSLAKSKEAIAPMIKDQPWILVWGGPVEWNGEDEWNGNKPFENELEYKGFVLKERNKRNVLGTAHSTTERFYFYKGKAPEGMTQGVPNLYDLELKKILNE